MSQSCRKIVYIHSKEYIQALTSLEKFNKRSILVHELISAYGLLAHVSVVKPVKCVEDDIQNFHSEAYIKFIRHCETLEDEEIPEEAEEFGLVYDCPIFPNLFHTVAYLAGGTITAARELLNASCDIAINWAGGWHHCKREEAAGFCYVNDIVLGILELRKKFERVLYVDLDLHHGDGVEEAFSYTPKIMCFSVHKFAQGFYPGTGSLDDIGYGKGQFYSINLPLKDGIRDQPYREIVCQLLEKINQAFKPNCIVCQFGADGLNGDPMGSFNLTLKGLGSCLQTMLGWEKPLLLLGGGGYHPANAARCWTYLTSLVCKKEISIDIPDHEFFLEYGPDFELHTLNGNRPDSNSKEYLDSVSRTIMGYLNHVTTEPVHEEY